MELERSMKRIMEMVDLTTKRDKVVVWVLWVDEPMRLG